MMILRKAVSLLLVLSIMGGFLPWSARAEEVSVTEISEEVVEQIVEEATDEVAEEIVEEVPEEESPEEITEEEVEFHAASTPAANAHATASGQCGDDVYWNLDGTGTLTIHGTGPMYSYSGYGPWDAYDSFLTDDDNIEKVIIEYGVTSIGDRAFHSSNVTHVYLPDTIKTIGASAFANSKIEYIDLPFGLTEIGASAFTNCYSLKINAIPDSVIWIDRSAFNNCSSIIQLKLSSGLQSIESYAFSGTGLMSLEIPGSVATIGTGAFSDCSSLRNIFIPQSVTAISADAFGRATTKLEYVFYEGSQEQWDTILISQGNSSLEKAFLHCSDNIASVDQIFVTHLSVVCYANQNDPSSVSEKYLLCPDVTVKVGTEEYTTGSSGQVVINGYTDASVTFSKSGYYSQTVPMSALKKHNAVYLQKVSDKPVINALWMGSKEVLHQELLMEYNSETFYLTRPDVDWGSSKMERLCLWQDGNAVELQEGNNDIQVAKLLDINEDIYLAATNAEGETTKKLLKIGNVLDDQLEGFSIKFGEKIGFTLPEGAGLLSGMEMSVGLFSPVPVEIAREGNKIYVAIGYQFEASQGTDRKMEVQSAVESAKDLTQTLSKLKDETQKWKVCQDKMKASKQKLAKMKGAFGVDGHFSVMAFAEGHVDSNGNFHLLESGGIMMFGFDVKYTQPFMAGPVPMFFEIKFSADIEAQLDLYLNQKIKEFTPNIAIEGIIALKGGIGVGAAKVLSVSGGLKGKLINNLDFYLGDMHYYQLKAALEWYINLKLLFASFDWGDTIKDAIWFEYPDPGVAVMALGLDDEPAADDGGKPDYYDASKYTFDDLSYLSSGSDFMGNASAYARRSSSMPFLANAYEGADPQTATFPDGSRIAVWIGYNEEYSGADGLNLYFSYFNDTWGTWSDPAVVENDGTMDAYPDLKIIDDVAYIVWQDASSSVAGSKDLESIADKMEISAASFVPEVYSLSFYTVTKGSNTLNMQPKLCGDRNGIYVVWHRNSANDWFGQNNANSLMYSKFIGGGWDSASTLYSGLGPLMDFAVTGSGGSIQVAYSMDGDGDLNTAEDVEVYINGLAATDNDYLDCGVTYSGSDLYWYSGGSLLCNGVRVMPEGITIGSDRFQILNENGIRAVVYAEENELASTLCAAYYDDESASWGNPIAIYDAGTSISAFSASVTEDAEISILIQNQEIVGEFDGSNPYGTVSLGWFTAPMTSNICLDSVWCNNENFVQDKDMPVYITVSNTGEQAIRQFLVEWVDENGVTVQKRTITETLLSGETREIELFYRIADLEQSKNLTVRVTPIDQEETDTADNSSAMEMAWNDLCVESLQYGWLEDDNLVIHASIVNRGYETQKNIAVQLIQESASGTVVDTVTLNQLDPFTLNNVSFHVSNPAQSIYYVAVDHKDSDCDYSNDLDFVKIEQQISAGCTGDGGQHQPGSVWSSDDSNHWHICDACGDQTDLSSHTGGTATCTQKATCTTCGKSYGKLAQHDYETNWNQGDANGHWHKCKNCDAHDTQQPHTPANGTQTCSQCGYVIGSMPEHVCSAGSQWYTDDNAHWHSCRICGKPMTASAHTPGSPATQNTSQTCTVCGHVLRMPQGLDWARDMDSWSSGYFAKIMEQYGNYLK